MEGRELVVVRDDGEEALLARRGEQLYRYLYKEGQWQRLVGVAWVDITHEQLLT